jgi:hypothetical protein
VFGYNGDSYFNSGVLVMNLDRIRARGDFLAEAFRFYNLYGSIADLADQDFLNAAFKNDVLFIDERFDRVAMAVQSEAEAENAILHYCSGGPKLLSCPDDAFSTDIFLNVLMQTEWGGSLRNIALLFHRCRSLSTYHASECVKSLLGRPAVYLDVYLGLGKVRLLWAAVKEWWRRKWD